MSLEKNKVRKLQKPDESPMEIANDRVEAKMKRLESKAKKQVAESLEEQKLAGKKPSPKKR